MTREPDWPISATEARPANAPEALDVEKGMEVRGPDGGLRWLKHPWSVLAFQIAGAAGLRAPHAGGRDEERETPPAERLLVDLSSVPGITPIDSTGYGDLH